MADMQELDLLNPGKLWATAEHQKDTTFHIVFPGDGNTRDKLKDGEVNPADDMIQPLSVPYGSCDANGVASFDLDASGRAADMLNKLTEHYKGGGETIETVRAIVVASARDGNKVPEKAVAEVIDLKLVAVPIIMLKGVDTYVTVQNFKGGKKEFKATFTVKGPCPEVEISVSPDNEVACNGQTGRGKIVVPTKEGETYTVTLPVPFKSRGESKQVAVPRRYVHMYPWGWRRGETDQQSFSREIWEGGFTTLRIAGTKNNAKVVQNLQLNAEAWASDWLTGTPPPPFYHNNC
jgi:hypothetical protein